MATTLTPPGGLLPALAGDLRKRAVVIGVFFLITEVAAIAGKLLRSSVASDPAYVLGAGSDMSLFLGSFFELLLVVAVIGTAVALYPLIKMQNESVALGYVFVRFLEAVLITVGAVSVLAVVTLRQGAEAAAGALNSGALAIVNDALVAVFDWTFILGPNLFLGLNSALLAYLMYKSGLVPRFIAQLGLVGGTLIVVSGTSMLFGVYELTSSWPVIMAVPVFAWEVSFALWLIVKGFKTPSSDARGVEVPAQTTPTHQPVSGTRDDFGS